MDDDQRSSRLARGLSLLEFLASQRKPLSTRQLIKEARAQAGLELTLGTCHRLLSELRDLGYVRHDEVGQRWTATLRLAQIGLRQLRSTGIPARARPFLDDLMEATRETAFLGMREGHTIVYIDEVLSSQASSTAVSLGSNWPLHAGALGKVLLSALPEREREQYLSAGLASVTANTIIDPVRLRDQIDRIRRDGYATNYGETVPNVFAVAAPLYDHTGHVVAAIGAAGPQERIGPDKQSQMIALVKESAQAISAELGHDPEAGLA